MSSRIATLVLTFAFAAICIGCNRGGRELQPIQQQRTGDYVVILLGDGGVLQQRSDRLALEFRNGSTNELTDVANVQVQASMVMPGMGPMFGNVSSLQKDRPGRYTFDAQLGMAGQWNIIVTFDPNRRVQFALRAQ